MIEYKQVVPNSVYVLLVSIQYADYTYVHSVYTDKAQANKVMESLPSHSEDGDRLAYTISSQQLISKEYVEAE